MQLLLGRMDANDAITKRVLDDEEFRTAVSQFYLQKVYERLRETR